MSYKLVGVNRETLEFPQALEQRLEDKFEESGVAEQAVAALKADLEDQIDTKYNTADFDVFLSNLQIALSTYNLMINAVDTESRMGFKMRGQIAPGVNLNLLLNSATERGIWYQSTSSEATLAQNYPAAGGVGFLIVNSFAGATSATTTAITTQEYHHIGTTGVVMVYRRRRSAGSLGTWSAWRAATSQRADNTAGRAVYIWDASNLREQLVYGDSGWRNITSTGDTGVLSAGGVHIRRQGYMVTIRILEGTVCTASDGLCAVLPASFKSDAARRFVVASSSGVVTARTSGDGSNFRIGAATTFGEAVEITYTVTSAWPTVLPGTAIGLIPNL